MNKFKRLASPVVEESKVIPMKKVEEPVVLVKSTLLNGVDPEAVKSYSPRGKKIAENEMKKKSDFIDLIEKKELQVSDSSKLIFSVSKKGEDGIPYADIRHHLTSDTHTGLTKQAIRFPLEYLLDFIEIIDCVNNECEEGGF